MACAATIGVTGILWGTIVFARWRAAHAVRYDTRLVLEQAREQLVRALQSRRGTFTLLRDTLDDAPSLNLNQRRALANSAVAHTRHLLGIGWIHAGESLSWWASPSHISAGERRQISRAVAQRMQLRNAWKVPSTWTVNLRHDRPLLIMLEPLRAPANRSSGIVGVFDLAPLLTDFFELTLKQPYPVQLADDQQLLYRSMHWRASDAGDLPPVLERPVAIDAEQWTLTIQPGTTHVAQTISWLNVVLVVLSLVVGIGVIALTWLLAMRTRLLQRAVIRRTAALRRTAARLRQLAITDELTGTYNRRFFLERWQREHERAQRYRRPLACLMIDVNHFKRINDVLGHAAGDVLIKRVAEELKQHLRQSDVLARFGGDEFIVALPETTVEQADTVAEKLRELDIHGPWTTHRQLGPVRLSVGVAHLEDQDESAQGTIQKADADLYASRRSRLHALPTA